MARSTQYISMLKRLIAASQNDSVECFYRVVEEIEGQMDQLSPDEKFDLALNLKVEKREYEERRNI